MLTATPPSDIAIIGVGHRLPTITEDNDELCKHLDVTPEWIIEKTGIQRRYIAGPEDTASQYAVDAAQKALYVAGIAATDVDLESPARFQATICFHRYRPRFTKISGSRAGKSLTCRPTVPVLLAA